MDTSTLWVVYIISTVISLWIFSEIIRASTKTNQKILLDQAQVKLLASIALKLGVPLKDILKDTKGININSEGEVTQTEIALV